MAIRATSECPLLLEDADQIIVPNQRPAATSRSSPDETAPVDSDATASSTSPININTASALELEILPGIGPALAARIVEYREANGPYQSVGELEAVRGISAAMVEELAALITVGP